MRLTLWSHIINFLGRLNSCFLYLAHRASLIFVDVIVAAFLSNLTIGLAIWNLRGCKVIAFGFYLISFIVILNVKFVQYLLQLWFRWYHFSQLMPGECFGSNSLKARIISSLISSKPRNSCIWLITQIIFPAEHIQIYLFSRPLFILEYIRSFEFFILAAWSFLLLSILLFLNFLFVVGVPFGLSLLLSVDLRIPGLLTSRAQRILRNNWNLRVVINIFIVAFSPRLPYIWILRALG